MVQTVSSNTYCPFKIQSNIHWFEMNRACGVNSMTDLCSVYVEEKGELLC